MKIEDTQEPAADQVLTVAAEGAVLRLTLARPARRNALSRTLVSALYEAISAVSGDDGIRVIVLAGEGAAFCAGGDIAEYAASAQEGRADVDAAKLASLLAAMTACPVPIVARIQGAAFGGGFGLVCAADIAIASDEATFSLSEARLGLIPAVISPYVFAALGAREAKARMLLAASFGAAEALRSGLVQQVVPAAELDSAVDRVIADVLLNAPGALAGIKQLPDLLANADQERVRAATAGLLAERLGSEEAREGLNAFLEKRRPHWVTAS